MPLYKGASFVGAALESVRGQSFADWECLCVDDGSRDGTGQIAERFASTDRRIRVIHQDNGGTSVARNTALDAAQGTYIAFLDEDDLYHPKCLEVLRNAAVRQGADAVCMDFVPFREHDSPAFIAPPPDGTCEVYDAVGLRHLAAEWYDGAPWEVWRHLYRRAAVTGVKFPAGVRIEQDLRWHYALLPRFSRYARIRWAGYGWRLNSNGGVLNPRAQDLISEVESFGGIAETLPRQLGFSGEQIQELRKRIAVWCKSAVIAPVRGGVRFTHREFKDFKQALGRLAASGVDLRTAIGRRKRLQWSLFMATGIETFMRL